MLAHRSRLKLDLSSNNLTYSSDEEDRAEHARLKDQLGRRIETRKSAVSSVNEWGRMCWSRAP